MRNWHGNLSPFGRWSTSGRPFSPAVLFANSEPGVWYDPSDLTTLFQDVAGTTPVTAAGQTVALMLDKSGNGLNATQSTAAARPEYQTDGTYHWLEFDGTDDFMVTPTITPGTDKAQVFAGLHWNALDASRGAVVNLNLGNYNSLALNAPSAVANQLQFTGFGDNPGGSYSLVANGRPSAGTAVLTGLAEMSTGANSLRENGVEVALGGVAGAGDFAAAALSVGAWSNAGSPFNGNLYSLITRFGPNLDTTTIEKTETYVANKTGVTL